MLLKELKLAGVDAVISKDGAIAIAVGGIVSLASLGLGVAAGAFLWAGLISVIHRLTLLTNISPAVLVFFHSLWTVPTRHNLCIEWVT